MLHKLKGCSGYLFQLLQLAQIHYQLFPASHMFFLGRIYCMEGNSAVLVHFTSALYNTSSAVHRSTHRHSRLVSMTASLRPVRMSHGREGGIVPPEMYASGSCKSSPAFHLFTPSVSCQTNYQISRESSRPTRNVFSGHGFYRRHSQMKTVKTSFF